MINETKNFPIPELVALGPEQMLKRAKEHGLLVPLNDYRVRVYGASTSGLTPQTWVVVKKFWTIYFSAAGAELIRIPPNATPDASFRALTNQYRLVHA